MKTIRAKEKEPVDLALWRAGRTSSADVAAAFDNTPGLAALPMTLPAGATIQLPEAPAVALVKTIRLWD